MDNPGIFSLGDVSVTAPLAGTRVGTGVTGLDGMLAVTFEAKLAVTGTTGTSLTAWLQTTLDQGLTFIDIARLDFGATAENKLVNLSGLTPKTAPANPTDGGLGANSCVDGLLGDQLVMKLSSSGTYGAGSLISGRISAR